jgi:lambda repressor-like predicted transcriptional regulator
MEKHVGLKIAWLELEKGMSLKEVGRRHNISDTAISNKLRRDNEMKYAEIMRDRIIVEKTVDLPRVWSELGRGLSLRTVAQKNSVSHSVLTNKLRRDNEKKYSELMRNRIRNVALSKVNVQSLVKEFEEGKSVNELARKHGVDKETLRRGLIAVCRHEYQKQIDARPIGFGSKTGTEDSMLVKEVRELLERNGILFKSHVKLPLEGHHYKPDFMTGNTTIIEVAGMTTRKYWRSTSEKLRIYIRNGYKVILVMEHQKLRKVQSYLQVPSKQFVIIEYEELKTDFCRFTTVLTH